MEIPSAAVEAHKASDTHSNRVQRTETTSGHSSDKAHAQEPRAVLALSGDGRHEKGGTRKSKVSGDIHSPPNERLKQIGEGIQRHQFSGGL